MGKPTGVVMAAAAHPDDIEFMMSGTLRLLQRAGWAVHYLNIANGSCGSATMNHDETVRTRTAEARESCRRLGAMFHEPLVDDLMVYYTPELVARLGAVVRAVKPTILLLQSPQDYMEDHSNSVRLMVTAAFCRGMPNFATLPPTSPWGGDLAVYHALPYGLRDSLGQPVAAEFYADVTGVMADKRALLACHRSQKEWLDVSQGMDSYLNTLTEMGAEVGRRSGRFAFAEGWRQHLHLGFGPAGFNPLAQALGPQLLRNPQYPANT
ncbi:MAG: PIG-L family deacetylase [Lentisphaeria bacterium]